MPIHALYLCEKPSQARDLAQALGCRSRVEGALHNGKGTYVTWAVGHLFEQKMPDEIEPSMKQWSLATLPFLPTDVPLKPVYRTKKQLAAIKKLLKDLQGSLYIATDYDREGEAIARNILVMSNYRGPVQRVKLSSLDKVSIQRALNNVVDGSQSIGLYHAAKGRQMADYHVGMNFSRLYTLVGKQAGLSETFNVGRVVAPTIALVVNRDREIEQFVPQPYFELWIKVQGQNGQFNAKWQVPEGEFNGLKNADEEGRCINRQLAEQVANAVINQPVTVQKVEKKLTSSAAPLPFDLTSLQRLCDSKFGLSADKTLAIAQKLYDEKFTTYPRTDSRYLPRSQQADVPKVLQAIVASDASTQQIVAGANPSARARVFNDSKVSAHHAIIPTFETVNVGKLNPMEAKVYDAIRRQYIAQFYPPAKAEKTRITLVDAPKQSYIAKGSVPIEAGWQVLFKSAKDAQAGDRKDEPKGKQGQEDELEQSLPPVQQGESLVCQQADVLDKLTKPPAYFTEATLLSAMEHVARYEPNPKYRELLKEVSGIGTPATRAETIKTAIKRDYLRKDKRSLHATAKARTMIDILPRVLTSPALTARWELELRKLETGDTTVAEFDQKIRDWIERLVLKAKDHMGDITNHLVSHPDAKAMKSDKRGANRKGGSNRGTYGKGKKGGARKTSSDKAKTAKCPNCGDKAWRNQFKQKPGCYWRCSGCSTFFDDVEGRLTPRV
ncbi:DNA topoisomerase 3 [Salinibius halmophilus]|uniref:DNA topoisomerase 3 n=1 Tax=Salinibius halmophilus TaxID=1853216 RepID=UPI000E66C2D3|nr:DNA topoisomerase 3 [Salinibius halmophilus]